MLLTFYPFFVNSILMWDVWGFFAFTDFTILKGKSLYCEVYSVLSISPLLSPCIFVLFTLLSCPGLWNNLKCHILMFIKSPISVCFSHYLISFGLASSRPQKLLAKSEQVDSRAKLENRLCGTLKRIEAPISHIWLRDWGWTKVNAPLWYLVLLIRNHLKGIWSKEHLNSKRKAMYWQTEVHKLHCCHTYHCCDCHPSQRTTA